MIKNFELNELRTRVEALHEFKLNQADTNTFFDNTLESIVDILNDHIERIETIEDFQNAEKEAIHADIEPNQSLWRAVFERLDRIEQTSEARSISNKVIFDRLKSLEDMAITKNEMASIVKKPYKCPICDGTSAMILENDLEISLFKPNVMITNDGQPFIWCKTCSGAGIVWG